MADGRWRWTDAPKKIFDDGRRKYQGKNARAEKAHCRLMRDTTKCAESRVQWTFPPRGSLCDLDEAQEGKITKPPNFVSRLKSRSRVRKHIQNVQTRPKRDRPIVRTHVATGNLGANFAALQVSASHREMEYAVACAFTHRNFTCCTRQSNAWWAKSSLGPNAAHICSQQDQLCENGAFVI
jgi:hypothetical protein